MTTFRFIPFMLMLFFGLFSLQARSVTTKILALSPPDSLLKDDDKIQCSYISCGGYAAAKPLNYDEVRKSIGYPAIAKEAGIEGQVVCRILVDEYGSYKKHIFTKSAHPLLQKEVEKYVKELCFVPGMQGKKPIEFWVNVPFNFSLQAK